jgi:hypothetical protein
MRGEEGFDLPRDRHTQPVDRRPPAASAGNAHGQVGQRADAVRVQGFRGPRRQPLPDVVADLWLWRRQRAQRLDRALHRTGAPLPFVVPMLEHPGQIHPMAAFCECNQLLADAPEHAPRGLPRGRAAGPL